jgi:hypothetical protein
MQTFGSRAQVWHNNAKMTTGRLTKKNLKKNKNGRIVSKKMSNKAKKEKRLKKAGWTHKKGHFGPVKMENKMENKKASKKTMKKRKK